MKLWLGTIPLFCTLLTLTGCTPSPGRGHDIRVKQPTQNSNQSISTSERLKISGSVSIAGVSMTGLPGDVISDVNGCYEVFIPIDWRGIVKPEKAGYSFTPETLRYRGTTQSRMNQDYHPTLKLLTLSGSIGEPGVSLVGLPGNPITSSDGCYRITVPHGWSGTVFPVKKGYDFLPVSVNYAQINRSLYHEDYSRFSILPKIASNPTILSNNTPSYSENNKIKATYSDIRILALPPFDENEHAELKQDLGVMHTILKRTICGHVHSPLNRTVSKQSIYIPDFGAIFILTCDWALRKSELSENRAFWEMACEAYRIEKAANLDNRAEIDALNQIRTKILCEALVAALLHATNIRHLDPDEKVVLSVKGTSSTSLMLEVTKQEIDQIVQGHIDRPTFNERVQAYIH
jgi:hypothetical protein